ncbi:hypothetical protein [Aeromonas phage AS-yj]|uniref:Uncharacterized protein n=1 Tax=Aeromonas phage AS-yj TaxID=2026115 RepID=A0A291LEL5_9CAUD|nr:hypothetical protein [Aeromonas phage AS-yj]
MKIKDGNVITFTGEYGVYESGEPRMSSLTNMMWFL